MEVNHMVRVTATCRLQKLHDSCRAKKRKLLEIVLRSFKFATELLSQKNTANEG